MSFSPIFKNTAVLIIVLPSIEFQNNFLHNPKSPIQLFLHQDKGRRPYQPARPGKVDAQADAACYQATNRE